MIKLAQFNKISRVIIISLCCVFLVTIPVFQGIGGRVEAASSEDLSSKLSDLTKQLADIKKKQSDVQNRLKQEGQNQSTLSGQLTYYDNRIESLNLTIEEKNKYIETLQAQIDLLQSQIKEKEGKIAGIENDINTLDAVYKVRVKSNFEKSFVTTLDTILDETSLESYLVQKEFSNTIALDNQKLTEELRKNKEDLDVEKTKLSEDLKQQQTLDDQVKAEQTDLVYQQQGLSAQKTNKAALLYQSQQNAETLKKQNTELDEQKKKIEQEQQAYIAKLANLPVNGTTVAQGAVIAKMGRTGYVLECTSSGYCYYPDPVKEPCAGAHTHLEIWKSSNGTSFSITDPMNYIPDKVKAPYINYSITQYYGPSPYYGGSPHTGVDFVGDSGCGTPVFAGVAGVLSYSCYHSSYVNADTYVATIYDPLQKIKVLYLHIQKIGGISC